MLDKILPYFQRINNTLYMACVQTTEFFRGVSSSRVCASVNISLFWVTCSSYELRNQISLLKGQTAHTHTTGFSLLPLFMDAPIKYKQTRAIHDLRADYGFFSEVSPLVESAHQ